MTKVIITESQIKTIINELFSQKLVLQLVHKFREEDNTIPPETLDFYIQRFQQIKDSPKIVNKDITTYSWENLRELVDINQPDEIQIKADDKELIYDQNNLKIFLTNTKRACVKYGTGYNFCISARSQDNEYYLYRFGDYGVNENTIYFIIDEDRTKEQNNDGTFKDPYHLIILMAKKHLLMKYDNKGDKLFVIRYVVTTANNIGNKEYKNFSDLTKDIPKLKGLDKLFPFVNPNPIEKKYSNIKNKYNDLLHKIYVNASATGMKWDIKKGVYPMGNINDINSDLKIIHNILNNIPVYVYSIDVGEDEPIYGTHADDKSLKQWAKHLRDDLDYEIEEKDLKDIEINQHQPNDPKYLEYIRDVKDIYMEYLSEKNQLNIQ